MVINKNHIISEDAYYYDKGCVELQRFRFIAATLHLGNYLLYVRPNVPYELNLAHCRIIE